MNDQAQRQPSTPSVKEQIERLLPDPKAREEVLRSLTETMRECHRLMPNSWGITLYPNFFRLNLGQVEVFVCNAEEVNLLVERRTALLVPTDAEVDEPYASAPGGIAVSMPVAGFASSYALFCGAHFSGLGLVNKRKGYTFKNAHSAGLIEYLRIYDSQIRQPLYVLDRPISQEAGSIGPAALDPGMVSASVAEGARRLAHHEFIERDGGLVEDAKRSWGILDPSLRCTVCTFSFAECYGSLGASFIEAHHRTPLADLDGEPRKNSIADLTPVCANCHRMLHRGEGLSVESLKERIQHSRTGL